MKEDQRRKELAEWTKGRLADYNLGGTEVRESGVWGVEIKWGRYGWSRYENKGQVIDAIEEICK